MKARRLGALLLQVVFLIPSCETRCGRVLPTSATFDLETDAQVEAGKVYYFNIGVPRTGAPGQDLVNQAYAGGSGQPMRAQSPLSAGFSGAAFYSLDPSAGAAAIVSLKAP